MNKDFFKKYTGVILVLLGVLCLVVYFFTQKSNILLVSSLVLEVLGILAIILLNRWSKS